jgi:hypothetical protein
MKPRLEEAKTWVVLAVALTAISLLPIWLVKFPPLQDYPEGLLTVHLIRNYSNPAFNYNEIFALSLFPVPYIFFDYLLLLLSGLFSLHVAGKVLLSLIVVLLPWSEFYLIRSVDKSKTTLGFFTFLFIYSWYFNKGLIHFVLSIPFFLLAVGYWWRTRDRLAWSQQAILAGLILCVYLSHLYSFMFLLYTFAFLATVSYRDARKTVLACIPFLPSLVLMGLAFAYCWPAPAGDSIPTVLFYPTLATRLIRLPIQKMAYLVSFSPDLERKIFYIAAAVAFTLLIHNVRALRRNIFFALFLMLVLLYVALPTTVSIRYVHFSCRVLIFIIFIGLLSLEIPKTVFARNMVLIAVIGLSLAHIAVTVTNYRSVDRWLRDYYAAIESIPRGERVLFKTDWQLLYVGKMTPFAFFPAYYYIDRGGRIPPVDTGQGREQTEIFQSVTYRHTAVTRADRLAELERLLALERPDTADVKGYAIALSTGKNGELASLAEKDGYEPLWTVGSLVVYRREFYPAALHDLPAHAEYFTRGFDQGFDYVLLYQDEARIDQTIREKFDRIFSQGYAHVFKRRVLI